MSCCKLVLSVINAIFEKPLAKSKIMKKIFVLMILSLVMCSFALAQSPLAELYQVKKISLLESTREDVLKTLAEFELGISDDLRYYQSFSNDKVHITVSYADGNCADDLEDWNVPEWKVTSIEISPKNKIQIENSGVDFSKLTKERHYANYPDSYVYHNRDSGVAFEVNENKIERIVLFPPKRNISLLCSKKAAKKFYLGKSIFGKTQLKDRNLTISPTSDVIELNLSFEEIITSCSNSDSTQSKNCPDGNREVSVNTISTDPENDLLTYNYYVSGGKIIGKGSKVIWDLSDVKSGTYKITAGVDDGCGICGTTVTKTVVVKECPDCPL